MTKHSPRIALAWLLIAVLTATHFHHINRSNAQAETPPEQPQPDNAAARDKFVFVPWVAGSFSCPQVSVNTYAVLGFDGNPYKDNRLTDENVDMRLSLLGYAPTNAAKTLQAFGGDTDPDAPNFFNVVQPKREPVILNVYKRYDWDWNENAAPPYGTRGGINNDPDVAVAVMDVSTNKGEAIYMPSRGANINPSGNYKAMVLYADEDEVTLVYGSADGVGYGYVVILMNFCTDPNLVSAYRAQLSNGKRGNNKLPFLRNDQVIGTAKSSSITLAIRDRGKFMDIRSRKDWWK